MKFDKVIKDFAKKVDVKVEEIIKTTAYEIHDEITYYTAVGLASEWKVPYAPPGYVGGRLRASLTINEGSPDLKVAPEGSTNIPTPRLGKLPKNPSIFIANNLPYANRVLQKGWSKQTPENMAEDAVQRAYLKLKAGIT